MASAINPISSMTSTGTSSGASTSSILVSSNVRRVAKRKEQMARHALIVNVMLST